MPEQGQYPDEFGFYKGTVPLNPFEFEMSRENLFGYMSQNAKLRKETSDANAQIYKQNWDAYNDYFQEMTKLRQELSDLEYSENEKIAASYDTDTPYQSPLPVQQKIGQIRNQIQTLDAANFQTAPTEPTTQPAGVATEPTAVGTYNPALDSASPFGYREPVAAAPAAIPLPPTGLGVASPLASTLPPPQPFQPTAAGTTIPDAGVGGLAEGAYAGDVIGGQTPFVDQYGRPLIGPGGGGTYDQLGGGTINAFEGPEPAGGGYDIPGIQTPGGRGFATYYDLYQGMGGGQTRPWSAGQIQQDIMKNQFGSQANSLREMLNPLRGFASGRVGAGAMYRGLMTQRADLGQGVQDYQVRRDAYGNIRSYTPGGTPNQPWNPYTSRYS